MKNEIKLITSHLHQILSGHPTPPFTSEDFKSLVASITSITALDANDPQQQHAAFESLGRKTALLLLDRLQAAMVLERTLSVMRNKSPNQM